MSVSSDFFLGGGSGLGIFPTFTPKRVLDVWTAARPEGFLGDGDTLTPPQAVGATGSIEYRNNVGTILWTLLPTAAHANATAWMTFNLDSVDNLLWAIAQDDVNNVLYLVTIDSAGTLVNIGNASTAINLSDTVHGWIANVSARKGANMIRAVQGTGNFTVRAVNVTFVIDYTNGAIVSETALNLAQAGSFESTSGVLFNPGSINADGTQDFKLRKVNDFNPNRMAGGTILAPQGLGLPGLTGSDTYCHLQWKGETMIINPGTTLNEVSIIFDTALYLESVDKLVSNFNADL